jgi:hypothetical protein
MGGRTMALNPGALACELIELVECWAADLHEDLELLETLAEHATTDRARWKIALMIETRTRRLMDLKRRRARLAELGKPPTSD